MHCLSVGLRRILCQMRARSDGDRGGMTVDRGHGVPLGTGQVQLRRGPMPRPPLAVWGSGSCRR
jgi:hypothetical protein